jgi:hydrogenase expression/formation protein HypC
MCLGIPMRVLEDGEWVAACAVDGAQRRVSLALVGPQAAGTWLLVHKDTAREVLSEDEANRIRKALQGITAALRGESDLSPYFGDLGTTKPRAPEH